MVYESDFYTTRRPYTRPSTYSVTTPRHYVVLDNPGVPRRAEEQYSYSYSSNLASTTASGAAPRSSSYTSTVERRRGTGPGTDYNYSTERSSRSGDGPGSYNASYSSTSSGRLPYGTNYRHYSYRV